MSEHVLDSSAVLALIFDEPGADIVRQVLREGGGISAVNLSEVAGKLAEYGNTADEIAAILAPLKLEVSAFTAEQAWRAAMLQAATRPLGLSLGDRCCLSLAMELGLPALTADRIWAELDVGVEVVVCR